VCGVWGINLLAYGCIFVKKDKLALYTGTVRKPCHHGMHWTGMSACLPFLMQLSLPVAGSGPADNHAARLSRP
jgi:hypothetical protein